MLSPKRTKYRKPHRVRHEGIAKGKREISFGEYGLQAIDSAWITNRSIEAARICISKYLKKGGKMWIRIFPHLSKTQKPVEVRMGSGKGAPEKWVAVVRREAILYEVAGIPKEKAQECLYHAASKLPIRCRFVERKVVKKDDNVVVETKNKNKEGAK